MPGSARYVLQTGMAPRSDPGAVTNSGAIGAKLTDASADR
jgi:hypothetical protein